MKIVKLNAIDSTNSYLKSLVKETSVENWTVVTAEYQTKGKGQFDNNWISDKGKNLTFSILTEFEEFSIDKQFYISKAISLAIYDTLSPILSTKINIKWPNDILAEHQKICGILIENSVKKTKIKHSIVGIGLNVNQTVFQNLPNATSMKLISDKNFDLDELLEGLVGSIKKHVALLNTNDFDKIDSLYLKRLYKINIPTMFRDAKQTVFMGKIIGVSTEGRLRIELENETIKEFNLKEIQFAGF